MEKLKKEWVFIVNPIAGNGAPEKIVPELTVMLQIHGIEADIIYTEKPGHASELSEKLANDGYRHIIAVGGDGTLNEVCRPLINRKDVITGIIPAGTGNDFNQILGFPDRFGQTEWDIFFKQNTIDLDAGSCNGIIFLNGMGLGFDAYVAAENYTEPGVTKKGSKYKYVWHIVKTLLFFREKKMTVYSETGSYITDCFINTISIGRRFAGGFYLTPLAIANDGLLDVCMIKKLSLPERFNILLKVPKGTHISDRRINYYQTKEINLAFPKVVPFHVDGELNFADKFNVIVIPAALKIIYNPDGKHFFKN